MPSSGTGPKGPAVAYFAKAPVPGLVKTRLCPPLTTDEAAALYGAFLRRVVRPVSGAEAFVYGWPGSEFGRLRGALAGCSLPLVAQQGADLWARMAACFADLFGSGFGPVLIRNTDSPDLEPALVAAALAQAAPGKVVLGPDSGGGYYLIALARPCPELFEGLVEGAATVFEATCQRATALGLEVVTLPRRADVDTFDDLLEMWRQRGG